SNRFGVPPQRRVQRFAALPGKIVIVGQPDDHDLPWESGEALYSPLRRDAKSVRLSLVHQFTHAAVPSPRPWIFEGLAHFTQALQRESDENRAAALEYMAQQL